MLLAMALQLLLEAASAAGGDGTLGGLSSSARLSFASRHRLLAHLSRCVYYFDNDRETLPHLEADRGNLRTARGERANTGSPAYSDAEGELLAHECVWGRRRDHSNDSCLSAGPLRVRRGTRTAHRELGGLQVFFTAGGGDAALLCCSSPFVQTPRSGAAEWKTHLLSQGTRAGIR